MARTGRILVLTLLGGSLTACPGGGGGTGGGGASATGGGAVAMGGGSTTAGGGGGTGESTTGGGGGTGGSTTGGGGGTGGSTTGGGGGTSARAWTLSVAAAPLTVSPTILVDAGVMADVPVDGGTLSATGPDGTTYQLNIPGDALWEPTTIVMTPLQLPAQPFGPGPAWGVQLLPDGLTFNRPLTLVITPPAGQVPAVASQVPVGWDGPTNTVSLALPGEASDGRLSLRLLHFSSYAYATAMQGFSSSLDGVRARLGGSAETRIQSAVAELLVRARQRALTGMDDGPNVFSTPEFEQLMQEYLDQVLRPRVAAAGTSCAAGRLALQTVLQLERQAQLLGLTVPDYGGLEALTDTVASVCLDEELALCREEHIYQRLWPHALALERQALLLGIDSSTKPWRAKALDAVYRCLQFRLDVTSTARNDSPFWSMRERMRGPVQLKKQDPAALLTPVVSQAPHGPLASEEYSITLDGCSGVGSITRHDAFWYVNSLFWTVKTDPREAGQGEVKDIRLDYFPGQSGFPSNPALLGTTFMQLDLCGLPPAPPVLIPIHNWWSVYAVSIGSSGGLSTSEGWIFRDWQVFNDGSAVVAKKDVSPVLVDGAITYQAPTSLVLTHTPQ